MFVICCYFFLGNSDKDSEIQKNQQLSVFVKVYHPTNIRQQQFFLLVALL